MTFYDMPSFVVIRLSYPLYGGRKIHRNYGNSFPFAVSCYS